MAGGKGKRLGRDKAYVTIGGKRLIDIALSKAFNFASVVLISCGKRELGLGVEEIKDVAGKGPLAGVYSVLLRHRRVLFLPVDMPFLTVDVFEALWRVSENADVAVCRVGCRVQPVVGVYSNIVLGEIARLIDSSNYKLSELIERLDNVVFLDFPEGDVRFLNINTRKDLEVAERHAYGGCFMEV